MRLRSDVDAASPLVVIATFVLGAVVVTAIAYALLFDRPEERLQLVAAEGEGGALAFEVSQAQGGLDWDEVTLRFIDRANTDHGDLFLHAPGGGVDEGDRVTVSPRPPAGTYVLLVLHGGTELSRLVVEL